jgi:hypothetical protein
MRSTLHALLALHALLPLAGCLSVSPPATHFSSEPPGARVLVDGHDSGWVTPCLVALDTRAAHTVTLALEGHASRTLVLEPARRLGAVDYGQGVNGVKSTIRFPILLPAGDLFFPFRAARALSPGRVFVRLRPPGAP